MVEILTLSIPPSQIRLTARDLSRPRPPQRPDRLATERSDMPPEPLAESDAVIHIFEEDLDVQLKKMLGK